MSHDTVRKLFQNEPGVLVLGGRSSAHTRRYTTLRIRNRCYGGFTGGYRTCKLLTHVNDLSQTFEKMSPSVEWAKISAVSLPHLG